ncbi:MAG: DUF86 domain-containing protein [Elusimicrobia bacterium]|nr:DUF86 domain-containing protein [Elusimicrobiota bacterium]
MTDRQTVDIRLRSLQLYVSYLRQIRDFGFARVSKDPFLEAALCRYLHLAIECVLDIGESLIAGQGWERPETNREVFVRLGEKNVLPKAFAKKFSMVGGLRNILVHDYLKVDLALLFKNLSHLQDFETFARHVGKCLLKR